jgi:ribonuclease G
LPEWLIERGIGEIRAALVDEGEIVEARIELDGSMPAGSVIRARLVNTGINGRNAIAVGEGGVEFMLPKGAPGVTQGATLTIEVTREMVPATEPWKLPLARVTDKAAAAAPSMTETLRARELVFTASSDELGEAGWDDLVDQARSGIVTFAGGELRISPTPAMTLIDVDGYLAAGELGILGAGAAALAIRRLDIGGSIGIDLPTAGSKGSRQMAAEAIDSALPKPFERTAVNGFGFVQIVRPRSRPSLIELAQDRPTFEARALLRRAAFEGPGAKRLVAHPAVTAALEGRSDWLEALSRQAGGAISLRAEAHLPIWSGYAEAV